MPATFSQRLYQWVESLRGDRNVASTCSRAQSVKLMDVVEEGRHSHEKYDFRLPERTGVNAVESEFLVAIAGTRAFRRLRDIRFLGALDYYLVSSPNGYPQNSRYTRAQHSWGVAMLAQRYLDGKDLTQDQRLVCLAAAMLHDIGHSPFSHTVEPAFIELFGINHHAVSEGIIRGEDSEFEDVRATLTNFGVDPDNVVDVLNGEDALYDRYFSGPINFDTIEGVLRSRHYIRMDTLGLNPWRVLNASQVRVNKDDETTVDNFWAVKGEIYGLVIRSSFGAFLDNVFLELFKKYANELEPDDFHLTESQMFKKFPALRKAFDLSFVEKFGNGLFREGMEVTVRHFHVNHAADFFARCDASRYQQTKERRRLQVPKFGPA